MTITDQDVAKHHRKFEQFTRTIAGVELVWPFEPSLDAKIAFMSGNAALMMQYLFGQANERYFFHCKCVEGECPERAKSREKAGPCPTRPTQDDANEVAEWSARIYGWISEDQAAELSVERRKRDRMRADAYKDNGQKYKALSDPEKSGNPKKKAGKGSRRTRAK